MLADGAGGYFYSDSSDQRVFRVRADGTITLVAGGGSGPGFGDGGPATNALLLSPAGLALDRQNNLYIADSLGLSIRRVALATGLISTIAGNGGLAFNGDNIPARSAAMVPESIVLDSAGRIMYVTDPINSRIRRIDLSTGTITTVAGSGAFGFSTEGAAATLSPLRFPSGLSLDPVSGNLAFVETIFVRQLRFSDGILRNLAGTGSPSFGGEGIPATQSGLPYPTATAYDAAGNLYISTSYDIRRVSAANGLVSKLAGGTSFGFADGPAASSLIWGGRGLASMGDAILFADSNNARIRRILNGSVTTVAGTDVRDGGQAVGAFLSYPAGAVQDGSGAIFIADYFNSRIRQVLPTGIISTFMSPALSAGGVQNIGRVSQPLGLTIDGAGSVYVADTGNDRVFRQNTGAGAPQLIAGTGVAGFSGDGGLATGAQLNQPHTVSLDAQGNIYIADYGNHRIRKITSATSTVSTVVGNGRATFSGDGGPANAAGCDCLASSVDRAGNIFIADEAFHRIRRVDAATGLITTVAGTGSAGSSGDGGPATSAQLSSPRAVAVDAAGNVFIADWGNSVLRMVNTAGVIMTVAGTGRNGSDVESGPARQVDMGVRSVSIAPDGSLLVSDGASNRVRRLTLQRAAALVSARGDGASGAPNAVLPIAARLNDASGLPVSNASVAFRVTSGTATLSSSPVLTGADGIAAVTVTLGVTPGTVTVAASVVGIPDAVTFTLTIRPAGPPPPSITTGGITGAGLSVPAIRGLVPLGLATVFGQNFAERGTFRKVSGADLVDGKLPVVFNGLCVTINGTRAPLSSFTDTQVTFQVPVLPPGTAADVRVVTGCGTANEVVSAPERTATQLAGPEFFSFVLRADGRNPIAAVDAVTGALVGAPGLIAGATFASARPGQVLSLYANNLGETTTSLQAGEIPQGLNPARGTVILTVGGRRVSNVLYAGVAPGNPGLNQINFILDADTPSGDQPVVVSVGGVSSPPRAYLTVDNPATGAADVPAVLPGR